MSSFKTKPMNFGPTTNGNTNGSRRGGPPPALPNSNTVLASSAPVVSSRLLKSTPATRPRHGQPPPLPASFQAAQAQAQQAPPTPSVAAAIATFTATPSLTSTPAPSSSPSGLKKSLSAHALSKQHSTDLSSTAGAGAGPSQGANGSGSYHKKNASSGGGGGSKYDREGNLITGGSGGHSTGSGSGGHSTGSGKKKDHSSPPFHPKNLNTRHHKQPSGTNSSPQLKSTGISRSNPPSPTAGNHMNGSGGMPKLGLPSPRFKAQGGSGGAIPPPPTHSQQPSYSLHTASHNQQPSLSQFSTSGSISVYRESTQQSSSTAAAAAPLLSPSRLHGHNHSNHAHGAHPVLHSSHQLHHHAPTTTSPSQIRLQWASNTPTNNNNNNSNSNLTSPSSHPPTPSSPNVRAKQELTSPPTLSANADTIKDLLLSIKKNPQFSSMVEYSIACLGSLCEDAVSMAEIVNAGGLQILIQVMHDCVNSATINTSENPKPAAGGSTGQGGDTSLAITPAERLMAVLANTISRMNLNNQLAAVLTQSGAVGALLSALQHFNAPATHVYVCLALDKLISASHSSLNVAAMSPSKRNRSLTSDPNANKPSHSNYHHQHHQSTHATPYNSKTPSTPLFSPSSPSHSSPAACAPLAISLHDTTPFLIQSGCLSRLEQLSRAAFTVMNHADERSCHTSLVIEQAQLLDAVGMLLAQMIRGGDHLTREHMNKVKATVSAIIDAASSTLQQSMDQKGKSKENNDRVWAAHHAVAFLVRLLEDPPSPPVSAIPGANPSSPPPPPPPPSHASPSPPSVLHDIIRQYMIESGTVDALVAALEHHSLAPYESVAAAARKTTISYSASMSSHHKKMAQKLPYSQHASSSSLVTATITPNSPHHAHTASTTSNTNSQNNLTAVSLPASSSISWSGKDKDNVANKDTPAPSSGPGSTSPTSPSSTTSSSSSLLSVPANFPLTRLSLAQNLISNGSRLVDGLVNQKHSKQNGVQEILDYFSNRLEVGVNEWDDNTARAMAKLSSLCLVPANADYLVAHNGVEIVMEVLRRLGAPPPQLVAEMKLPKPSPKTTPSVPSTTFPSPSHSPHQTLYDTRTASSEDDASGDYVPGVANISTDVNGIVNKGKPPRAPSSSNKKSPPPLPPTASAMGLKKRLSLISEEPKFGLSVKLQKQTAAALRAAFSATGDSAKSSASASNIAANTFGTGPNQVIVGGQMTEHHAAIAAAAARVLARTAARPEHAKFICDSGGLLTLYSLVQQQVDMESDRIRPEFQIHRSQIIGAGLQALQQLVEGGERHHVEYVMDLDIGGLVSQCVDMHDLPRMEYVDQCAMQLLDTISTYDDDIAYVEQVANMSKHGGIAACVSILQHHMDDGALLAVNMEAFRRVSLIDQFAGAGCVDVIYECGGYDMLLETLDQHVEDERIVNTSLAMLSAGCKHVPQVVTMLRNQNEVRGNLISQVQRQHPNHALIQQQADAINVRLNKPPPAVACCGKCVIQ